MRKATALLLAVLLLVTLVAGCNGEKNPESEAPASLAPPSYSPVLESVEPPEGDTFTLPLTEETVNFTMWIAAGQALEDFEGFKDNWYFQEMEFRTNVHIDFWEAPVGATRENFQTMVLSGDYADFVQAVRSNYTGGVDKAISDKFLIRMNEIIDQYMPNYRYHLYRTPDIFIQGVTDTGNIWGVHHIVDRPQGAWVAFGIRNDWLKTVGMEQPTTVPEMEAVLTAFKPLTKDAYGPLWLGIGGFNLGMALSQAYNVLNPQTNGLMNKDGVATYPPLEAGYKEYAALLQDWYAKELINKDYIGDQQYFAPASRVASGEIGIFDYIYQQIGSFKASAEDPNFDVVPQQPVTKDANSSLSDIHVRNTQGWVRAMNSMGVTTACENIEIMAKYWDYAYTEDGIILSNWGLSEEDVANGTFPGSQATYAIDPTDENGDGHVEYYLPWVMDKYTNIGQIQTVFVMFNMPGYCIWSREVGPLSDSEKTAEGIWGMVDDKWMWPDNVTLTTDEGDEAAGIKTNCDTASGEWFTSVVLGDKSPDTWETDLIPALEGMNVSRLVTLYQQALDRYIERENFYK